ncbi:hypothetical protein ACLESO_58035, partial [Pyxidicoccus sp. 3LG]
MPGPRRPSVWGRWTPLAYMGSLETHAMFLETLLVTLLSAPAVPAAPATQEAPAAGAVNARPGG